MANNSKNLDKLNEVFSSINLGDFYDEDYCDYAIYRALQRIPHLVDGFAQTQRKVIFTCIDTNVDKKMKVADLAAVISLHTKYHHGSGSIETALTNLVPLYNNQVPLLREDGTYGSRSERDASAARYIETRLFKYSKVIFNDIDNSKFIEEQRTEGKLIEPKHMLPIIPLLLINGQSQIGVGYASDVLPRKIETVIQIMKDILTGKQVEVNIPPHAPLFAGAIVPNDKGGWAYYGIVKEDSKGDFHITEVPPKYTRESYLNILEALKDAGKIKSYVENIVGDDFDIVVKMGGVYTWTKTKKNDPETKNKRNFDAITFLKLMENKSENLTVINTADKIVRYDNISTLLQEYMVFMLGIYRKRKAYLVDKLEYDTIMNREKIRFIKLVNTDIIILKNRKKVDIYADLETQEFVKFDDTFEYLLRMQISSLTFEKIIELEDVIALDADNIIKFRATPAAQLWIDDLREFEKYLAKGE